MLKVYGMMICPDCASCREEFDKAGIAYESLDFAEATKNLKEFLKLRDASPLFQEAKEAGNIGIPCILKEDGSLTLDYEEFLKA